MKHINQDVLVKTLRYLRDKGIIDEDDVHYKTDKFPVTEDEFSDLLDALVNVADVKDAIRDVEDEDLVGIFGECRTSFRYQDVDFTLNTLFGQGSVTTLIKDDYNPEYCPFVDENVVDLADVISRGG